MKKALNWQIFWILWGAAVFGLIAIVPYSLALQANALKNARLPMPLPVLATIQLAEQAILFAGATAAGLFFANRTGLGLPILEARLRGEAIDEKVRAMLPLPIVLGVIGALLIMGLELLVFQPALKAQLAERAAPLLSPTEPPGPWRGFLASFYGGIDEEILLRLFVLSLLAWLGHFISKTSDGRPTAGVLWIANIIAAVLFGLGHLPMTARLVPLTSIVVLRAVVLNGLLGIVYGWLYFTRGLESAMVSHFASDLIVHVLFAL